MITLHLYSMNELWNKSFKTNLLSHGENVHEFKFKPPHGSYSLAEVFQRADFVRLKLKQYLQENAH